MLSTVPWHYKLQYIDIDVYVISVYVFLYNLSAAITALVICFENNKYVDIFTGKLKFFV